MKRFFAPLFSISLVTVGLSAQEQTLYNPYTVEPLTPDAPLWMHEIEKDPSGVNVFRMDSLFQSWLAVDVNARIKTRQNKLAVNFYRRWRKAYEPFVDARGRIVLPTREAYFAQLDQKNRIARQRIKSGLQSAESQDSSASAGQGKLLWHPIGPNTTVDEQAKPKDYQACIYRITAAPSNHRILYCGAEGGVVFRTEDKGESWQPCHAAHDFGGPIYALAVHPDNPDIVYAGGGNALWKSTDGGENWTREPEICTRVNSIRINPENPQEITVTSAFDPQTGTEGGFYYSDNGGVTYTLSLKGIGYDHELQPGNPQQVYLLLRPAGQDSTFLYTSADMGKTFQKQNVFNLRINAGRLAVTEAPGGADYLYALVTTGLEDKGLGKPFILQSKDKGTTWENKTSRVSSDPWDGRNSFFDLDETSGGQGFFDMTLGVSNKNPEHVIFGLCSAYRSTQGGAGGWHPWYENTAIGGYAAQGRMHPDIQDICVIGDDTWISTDGGVKYSGDFFATDGVDKMKGIFAADYHGFDIGWNEDVMAGGRWHNGDAVHVGTYGEGNTMHVGGVEMATGHVMLSDAKKVYFGDAGYFVMPSDVQGGVQPIYNKYFTTKKPYETLQANGRIVFDPRYALRLAMNGKDADDAWGTGDIFRIYVSEDEGVSFKSILNTDGEMISNYEYARSNPDVMYVCGYLDIYKTADGGKTWNKLPQHPFPGMANGISPFMLAVDPHDDQVLWVTQTYGKGAVRVTRDGGKTWEDPLDEKMKEEAFYWIVLTGDEVNGVYLGTGSNAKVYYKDDTMKEWMEYSAGLNPGARLTRLVPFYKDGKLRAATNQGIWEAPLVRQDFRPVAQPLALNLGSGDLTRTPDKEVWFDSYSIVKQEPETRWEWRFSPEPKYVSDPHVRNPRVVFGRPGDYDVTLKITTPSGKTHERTIKKMIHIAGPTGIEHAETVNVKVSHAVASGEVIRIQTAGLEEEKVFSLHETSGKLVRKQIIPAQQTDAALATQGLAKGLYVYELKTRNYKTFGKILIE